jgi:hypothetical protein
VRWCTESRRRERERGGGLGFTVDGGFERACSQVRCTPTTNRGSLAAILQEEEEGKQRGGVGLLIGVVEASNYAGSKGIEEGKGSYCERRKRSC